ncbi:WGxxGxxG family protein [Paenibacillus septentrionalis]|uniref:WGxxGxxG family protein n=1 Tax=Paenibacillus septentrionalis TaxID=429342 RepID=A0ABW1V2I0_9BACL
MKKLISLAFAFALLFTLPSVSAHAMTNNQTNAKQSRMTDSTINDVNNYQTNDGAANNFRANNTTNNQSDRYRATANNYRTNAVDNDRGNNWGWLGLLGLTGLLGLRSRQRERT